jgi:hypothetical protein
MYLFSENEDEKGFSEIPLYLAFQGVPLRLERLSSLYWYSQHKKG